MTHPPHWRLAALALLLALAFTGLLAVFPDPDPDIWWHVKTGEIIVTEHTIPRTDIFTYTAHGRPWVTHEWLTEVILYAVYQLGGVNLLVFLKAFLAIAAVGISAWATLVGERARDRLAPVALGVLLAAPLLATRAFARPHLFTAVLLAGTLLLLRLEGKTGKKAYRLALIPLFVLWANLHSGFILGLLLVVLYWAGEAIDRTREGKSPTRRRATVTDTRAGMFAILLLATLLNPHHVHALLYPFQLVARPEVRERIFELRNIFHPDFRGALFLGDLLAVAIVLGLLVAGARRRVVWAVLLPGLVFGLLGVRAVRGVSEFAVLVPALIGVHGEWLGRRRLSTFAILLLVGVGTVATFRWGVPMGREGARKPGLGISQQMVPDQAAIFLRQVDTTGRLFNTMGFGGYLIHELWPGRQVYIDGRLDVFPDRFLSAYGHLMRTGEGWEQTCETHGISLAIVELKVGAAADSGLHRKLRTDPDWSCVFISHNALVYARRVPEHDALIARFGCPLDASQLTMDAIRRFAGQAPPDQVAQAIGAMTSMAEVAPQDKFLLVVLGVLLDATGRSAEGAERIRQATELGPADADARVLLAWVLLRAGSLADADRELTRVLAADPRRFDALVLLADLRQREGNIDGALRALQAAQTVRPADATVRRRLEELRKH